jgi:hypothetical protein
MVKCCIFFAVRTEFLNIIWTSFGFKGLRNIDGLDMQLGVNGDMKSIQNVGGKTHSKVATWKNGRRATLKRTLYFIILL